MHVPMYRTLQCDPQTTTPWLGDGGEMNQEWKSHWGKETFASHVHRETDLDIHNERENYIHD